MNNNNNFDKCLKFNSYNNKIITSMINHLEAQNIILRECVCNKNYEIRSNNKMIKYMKRYCEKNDKNLCNIIGKVNDFNDIIIDNDSDIESE